MYNTRRNSYGNNNPMGQQQRSNMSNNFVAGGQLKSQNGPGQANARQQGVRGQPQQQVAQQIPTMNSANKPPQQKVVQKPQILHHHPQQNLTKPPVVQTMTPTNNVVVQQTPQKPPVVKVNEEEQKIELATNTTKMEVTPIPDELKKKAPSWKTKAKGKISKQDKIKKRNQRLRKILQPKNAAMVLNELVGSLTTNVEEKVSLYNPEKAFRATIIYDNIEHEGFGKSKAQAKSAASETVIRYLFLKRVKKFPGALNPLLPPKQQKQEMDTTDNDGDVTMEEEDDNDEQILFSWSHIASFALHKLLATWDEGGNIINSINGNVDKAAATVLPGVKNDTKLEMKPAKKLPENAANMNPIMLIYQMRPNTSFNEISIAGTPPNVMFSFKCIVDDNEYIGRGPNKKTARKIAAYLACQSVLNINYPQDIQALIAASFN